MNLFSDYWKRLNSGSADEIAVSWGLCFFAFGLTLSVSVAEAGLGLALAGWLWRNPSAKFKRIRENPLLPAWGFYLAAALLASVVALDRSRSAAYLPSDIIKCIASLFLPFALRADRREPVLAAYLLGACAAVLVGGYFMASVYAANGGLSRMGGVMNPVTFGEIIALAFGLAFIRAAYFGGALYISAAALTGCALLLSQSRGAILGCVIFLALSALLERRLRRPVIVVFALMALLCGALAVKDRVFYVKLRSVPAAALRVFSKSAAGTPLDYAAQTRLNQWTAGLRMLADYPLLGVGPGNVKTIFHFYHPAPIDRQFGWGNVHSLYLQQAAERGMLGLGALLYLLFSFLTLAWKSFRAAPDDLTLWAVCMLPGFLVMNVTETSFQHAVVALSLFLMLAAARPLGCDREKI